jgi:hypothetical protein
VSAVQNKMRDVRLSPLDLRAAPEPTLASGHTRGNTLNAMPLLLPAPGSGATAQQRQSAGASTAAPAHSGCPPCLTRDRGRPRAARPKRLAPLPSSDDLGLRQDPSCSRRRCEARSPPHGQRPPHHYINQQPHSEHPSRPGVSPASGAASGASTPGRGSASGIISRRQTAGPPACHASAPARPPPRPPRRPCACRCGTRRTARPRTPWGGGWAAPCSASSARRAARR